MELNDVAPSLSIEERVKLRRTKPLQPSTSKIDVKPTKTRRSQTPKVVQTKRKKAASKVKNKKFFLGSGLDLDNIVLGNRQRRCVQT